MLFRSGMIINYFFAIVVDKVMYGINSGKVALIVTQHGDAVANMIDETSGRGSTLISAKGGYKRLDNNVVMCACSNKEMFSIEKAVKQIDPQSFIIIMESNEVVGEGFRNTRVAERQN